METYKTVEIQGEQEFIERKSRFIGAASPVTTEREALDFIEARKTKHWNATHNCWAYILRENQAQRYSDDGEPQGTAGIPILEILRKEEVFDTAVVVTRYFGGIMLGAGGLIRAYSQGAKTALDAGNRVTMAACQLVEITLPYPLYDKFINSTQDYPMLVLDTIYTHEVTVNIRLRKDYTQTMERVLTELSSGTISPIYLGEEFAPI